MREKPILFRAPMVRAILDGSKTQTRRIWEMPAGGVWYGELGGEEAGQWCDDSGSGWWGVDEVRCPYGRPGDRLWVRETFFAWGRWETRYSPKKKRDEWHFVDMTLECDKAYLYAADGETGASIQDRRSITPVYWKRSAIFMPRRASRITLEITGVRVERLQDISEEDAAAEGVREWARGSCAASNPHGYTDAGYYSLLWEQINGPGSWDANSWVWVVEFNRAATDAQGPEVRG
jgi:hypothetical protein